MKNILLIALLVLLTGMVSCKKDHDIPTGKVFNGGSGGGSTTDSLTISVTANPSEGGTVSGGGKYLKGKTCVVAASANEGYVFSSWTENGTQVSTSVSYSFTVDVDRTLVANFSVSTGNNFTITAVASPEYGGVISGSGIYQQGQSCTVTAIAETGYTFVNWTENGSQVSTNATYSFTVNADRTLVANFIQGGSGGDAPTGAIDGKFTINADGDQVYFSQGNLQYQASTNTWKFADNQYDYVGSTNSNISSTYSGWIDLFGWGTSGYNHGANCYQPWSTSQTSSDYHAYGLYYYNLYDQTGMADWGYSQISNGGNQTNQWRTLTQPEWTYVFYTRSTTSGIRYAKANVNNMNGIILLPDDWISSIYSLSNTNTYNTSFSSNMLTASQWSVLEQAGAVFLPAAGFRNGTSLYSVGSVGGYWSASYDDSGGAYDSRAYDVNFTDSNLHPNGSSYRYYGRSVRLVRDAEN